MTKSQLPVGDAHRQRILHSVLNLIQTVSREDVAVVGCGRGAMVEGLRRAGVATACYDVDPRRADAMGAQGHDVREWGSLGGPDGRHEVVVVRGASRWAADVPAVLAAAWRAAKRCVIVVEPESLTGLLAHRNMEAFEDLRHGARAQVPVRGPVGIDEVLAAIPGAPGAVETRSFGLVTQVPLAEFEAMAAGLDRPAVAALRGAAEDGALAYRGVRGAVYFREAPDTAGQGSGPDAEDAVASASGEVTLRVLGKDDIRAAIFLQPRPAQSRFVAPNTISLAQAALTEDAWFRGVFVGETMVGLVMVDVDPNDDLSPFLWRFMVDARQQGRGVGRRALEICMEHFHAKGATEMHTSVVEAPGGPRAFYESLGFAATGEMDEDEVILRKNLG